MIIHGSLSDWKNGRAFSSEGIFLRLEKSVKIREFYPKYWKSPKKLYSKIEKIILEKMGKFVS